MNKIEAGANIALIMVSCVAGYVMLDRHLAERRAPSTRPPQASAVGRQIPLAKPDGPSAAPANVFVAVATGCHFCKESMGFYKKIVADRQHMAGNVRITFISRQPEADVKKYLTENGVQPDAVAKIPAEIAISGTPTILVSGPDGIVKNQFIGRLSESKEKDFVHAVEALCKGCGFGAGI